MNDPVKNPSHYQFKKPCLEVRDVIRDRIALMIECGYDYDLIYDYSNAIKYLLRWPAKNGAEDVNKAKYCIDTMISLLEDGDQQTIELEADQWNKRFTEFVEHFKGQS